MMIQEWATVALLLCGISSCALRSGTSSSLRALCAANTAGTSLLLAVGEWKGVALCRALGLLSSDEPLIILLARAICVCLLLLNLLSWKQAGWVVPGYRLGDIPPPSLQDAYTIHIGRA
jgi:hypothetical protein